MKRFSWLIALALLAGCAHAPPSAPMATASVTLHEPMPGLYTAGQPAASDWAAIRARGVRTVVDLRAPGELQGRDEAAEVRAAGMAYVSIPIAGAADINRANAQRLHDVLAPSHGEGVLVHCHSGNRAGALLGLEQADFDGMSPQAALTLGRSAGVTKLEPTLKAALGIAP